MKPTFNKEDIIRILKSHGHQVISDRAFVSGSPISEIEVIVDLADVVSQIAYQEGKTDGLQAKHSYEVDVLLVENLKQQIADLKKENSALGSAATKPTIQDNIVLSIKDLINNQISEAEILENAILSIQNVLSGGFSSNLKLELTEEHIWISYGTMRFIVEPMEIWQALQSCIYLSGLEVDV